MNEVVVFVSQLDRRVASSRRMQIWSRRCLSVS